MKIHSFKIGFRSRKKLKEKSRFTPPIKNNKIRVKKRESNSALVFQRFILFISSPEPFQSNQNSIFFVQM